jgi:hypothetical protein
VRFVTLEFDMYHSLTELTSASVANVRALTLNRSWLVTLRFLSTIVIVRELMHNTRGGKASQVKSNLRITCLT